MEKYSCDLPFFLRRVERKNMPADYAKISERGKRVGLHYSQFELFFEVRSLENQTVALEKFLHRYPNPRSRASARFGARHLRWREADKHIAFPQPSEGSKGRISTFDNCPNSVGLSLQLYCLAPGVWQTSYRL